MTTRQQASRAADEATAKQYTGEARRAAEPYVAEAKQTARHYQERTLVSKLVRYSLLLESTLLTAWGFYHFFFPAAAAQWSFPSTVTNWPHYQIAVQSAGALAVLFASALCTLSFYPQPHTARSLGSGHLLSGAMLAWVHHSWVNTKGLEQGTATKFLIGVVVLQFLHGAFLLAVSSQLPEIQRTEQVEQRQKKAS